MDKLLLTPEEAAELIGIGRTRMYALIGSGLVASIKIGRSRRIPVDAIREFVGVMLEKGAA